MLTQTILKCCYDQGHISTRFYTITYEDPDEVLNYLKSKHEKLIKTALSDLFTIDYRPYNVLKLYHLQSNVLRITDEKEHVLFIQNFPIEIFYYFPHCGNNRVEISNSLFSTNLDLISFTEFLIYLFNNKENSVLFRFRKNILFDFNILTHIRDFSRDV